MTVKMQHSTGVKRATTGRKVLTAQAKPRRGITVRNLAATALFGVSNIVLAQGAPTTAPAGVEATVPATMSTTLPAGHPAISASALPLAPDATLPAGHPPMGTPSMTPGMSLVVPPAAMGGTLPASAKGTLNITAVAARANGLSVANEPVTIEFFQQGVPVKRLESKTDGLGKFTIPDVPLMPPTQVVLSAKHAGLFQQVMTPDVTLDQPVQSADWKMYEPTEEMPAWNVAMEHMIVEWKPEGDGVRVTEMLSINNPSDLAWIGKKVTETTGEEKRLTLTLPLPPEAENGQTRGGFDDDQTWTAGKKILTGTPFYPGRNELQLTYEVPARNGALDLPIIAPAAVDNLIVFVPADDTQVKATGITGGTPMDSGNGRVRMYTAQNLAAGDIATLVISGIKPAPPSPATADEGAPDAAPSAWSPRNFAVGGAFVLVLLGAALMLMKKPAAKQV